MESKKKVISIIQAHMSSTRLPGKVMKDIMGMPALYRMIERVRQSKLVDDIVIATSTKECDDVIIEACEKWGVKTFRGSDSDVLSRYWGAAKQYPADYYIRQTSDCPLIAIEETDKLVEFFLENNYRYAHHKGLPGGCGAEIFTAELLDEAMEKADKPYEHEHVTPYMYWEQDSIGEWFYKEDASHYRITLDTPEDYQAICAVYEALYKPGNSFTVDEMVAFLKEHPEVVAINSMIVQKKVR